MGGVAGHAGVFATAADVGAFMGGMLRAVREEQQQEQEQGKGAIGVETGTESGSPPPFFLNSSTALLFTSVAFPSLSSRALGWDTNRWVG